MFDEPLTGKILNNSNEIIDQLARGGMATVYRAHQISMKRDVAIKILPREFLHEPTFLERFRQEAAIAARLEHRAIVPVYDYGEWDGTPYIVMRYMEGGSVDSLIEYNPLDLERTQQIIRQVASALDYAHKRDVLHRDLKPSNILLDGNGDAYITDFGIARILSQSEKLTTTGVVGTPAYMSPEQAQGLDLDGRSDIYALGIVLYEMLTCKRPFDGDTPYSVAVMQVTKPPPPPRSHNPTIPHAVEMIILRALEKDRDYRFRTASELAGALDDADLFQLAQTTPRYVTTPQPLTPFQPPPVVQRRRAMSPLLVLGGALILALVVAAVLIVGYLLLYDSRPHTPDFAATGVFRLTATAGDIASPLPQTGKLLIAKELAGRVDLFLLDLATGSATRLTDTPGAEADLALSPDGNWVAYRFDPDGAVDNFDNTQAEIYLQRLDGTEIRQLTSNLLEEHSPTWTPDGQALIYVQLSANQREFRLIRHDLETGQEDALYQRAGEAFAPAIAPDGERIVFSMGAKGDRDSQELVLLDLNTNLMTPLTSNTTPDWYPQWHPTGTTILYLNAAAIMEMSDDGANSVVVYDGKGNLANPIYNEDGTRIVFTNDGRLYSMTREGTDLQSLVDGIESVWLKENE